MCVKAECGSDCWVRWLEANGFRKKVWKVWKSAGGVIVSGGERVECFMG